MISETAGRDPGKAARHADYWREEPQPVDIGGENQDDDIGGESQAEDIGGEEEEELDSRYQVQMGHGA